MNALPQQPALIIHTGDITHLSKPAEFDTAQQLLSRLRTDRAAHRAGRARHHRCRGAATYFARFGKASDNKGYYSFDHAGVHFIALINVLNSSRAGSARSATISSPGSPHDLKARSSSTPIVVFAHMPLWTIYEPWGWGTGDADQR